jgi:outer membrane protein assembly factor BamA
MDMTGSNYPPLTPANQKSVLVLNHDDLSFLPAPYVGYSDTYGFLSGVAGVLYETDTQTRLTTSVLTNFNGYLRGRVRLDWFEPGDFVCYVTGSIGNDFQDYYGEGDQTPTSYKAYVSEFDQLTISYQKCLEEKNGLYIGPLFQYLSRQWQGITPFDNEDEWRIGIQATRDTRDKIIEPHRGTYFEAGIYSLPSNGATGFNTDVLQADTDARWFLGLPGNQVLAFRANTGWSIGDPSYSFEYTLGGLNELRGYHSNRFRGNYFYGLQAEWRFPIFDWINGSTSVDAGDATDGPWNGPQFTYQVGVRTDVLEKEGLIFRADWGFAVDQNEIQFNISEPY